MGLKLRLCVMMFLQFFIWGAWLPLVFGYLPEMGFSTAQQGWILGAFNLSALIAMFFSNQFADRNFAAEKFLSFSHLVGGVAMAALAFVRPGWLANLFGFEINISFWAFFVLMLVHCLFYVPTISITNAIAFANMKDSKEFGFVRLWGTIGWIAVSVPFVFILVDWGAVPKMGSEVTVMKEGVAQTVKVDFVYWLGEALGKGLKGQARMEMVSFTFLVSGAASLVLAAFSLILPHTPPKPANESGGALAWVEALKLLAQPFVFVLFIVTFLDAAIHQAYFYWADTFLRTGVNLPSNWVMPVMSIGQIAEILTMAVLGFILKTLGWRMTMVIGILGHAGRFAVFAFASSLPVEYQKPAAIAVNVLHGICYAFFFATVYIFIDEYFPKDARSSAQGLFNVLILGVGPFVSNFVSGELGKWFKLDDKTPDFKAIFLVPCITAVVAALLLLLLFHPPKKAESPPAAVG